jgi:hypothetical protein
MQCGAGRKTTKPKIASAVLTKDPQSLAAKVTYVAELKPNLSDSSHMFSPVI